MAKMKKLLLLSVLWSLSYYPMSAQQTVGLFVNTPDAYEGYTLFTAGIYTYLIDNCGRLVQQWESNYMPGQSVYLLENGNLLRTARIGGSYNGGGTGGRIELFSWDNELLWSFDYSTSAYQQHHDIAPLPNGNILLIAWEGRTPDDAIANGRNPNTVTNFGVWSEQIIEIEPTGEEGGNIVWQWHLWDHLVQDFDDTKLNYGVVADHPELVDINFAANGGGGGGASNADWIHLNAIHYNPELDQIVVSSRHLSEFWVIDHSTTTEEAAGHTGGNAGKGGDILYRWGNPQSYQRGTAEDQTLFRQHDVQWIADTLPGAGHFLMFNNGQNRPGGNYSSIEEIVAPLNTDGTYDITADEAYLPETALWTYTASPQNDFYSSNISGVQRLPNGNTLICEGRKGHLFEVTPTNEIVWDYICPVTTSGPINQGATIGNFNIFRGTRYGLNYAGFIGKDLTPGDPIELNPLPYDCVLSDIEDIALNDNSDLKLLANPVIDKQIHLLNEQGKSWDVELYDASGRLVYKNSHTESTIQINCGNCAEGIFFLRAWQNKQTRTLAFKIIL